MKKISLLLYVFLVIPVMGYSYDLPLGIPDPGFGLDAVRPSRPDPWTSEVTGYYYIEDTAGCSKTTDYGTPDEPRCYIPNPIAAGSVVEVHGTYNHTTAGSIQLHGTGTAEQPIWVVGENHTNMPTFTDIILVFGSYIYIQDIHGVFTGTNDRLAVGTSSHSGYGADHIMVRDCLLESNNDKRTHAITTSGYSEEEAARYIIYVHNTCRNFGVIGATIDLDAHVLMVNRYSRHVWILDNTVYHCGGAGISIGQEGPAWHYTDNQWIFAGRNNVYDTTQASMAIKGAWHVVFSENNVHDPITRWVDGVEGGTVASPSKCFGWKGEPQDYWIINNICQNASYGVHGGATVDNKQFKIYIIGNTFRHIYANKPDEFTGTNTWGEAAISMIRGGYVYAIGNSIYDAVSGINAAGPGGTSGQLYHYYIENNIIENIGTAHMVIGSRDIPAQTYVRNNIIYQPDSSTELIRWGSHNYNLSEFKTATGKGQNNVLADPKFVDPENNNFHLASDSPAIDAGVTDTGLLSNVFATFQSIYGLNIRKDIVLTPRPQGSGWDIGAYEFDKGGSGGGDSSGGGQLAPPSGFKLIQ